MYGGDPIYLQSFAVGEMIAHQIAHKTDKQFGRRWDKRAGAELQKNFYSRGAELTIDESMRRGTGEPLTPTYLVRFLKAETPKN
jgi:Zn-dependent M32 family carboxypeptidase